jgi:hypothetical protein
MVANDSHTASTSLVAKSYKGSVRWRKATIVSSPLARLTLGPDGLDIEPSFSRFSAFWHLIGIPTFHANWPSVEDIELITGIFGFGRVEGVSFIITGRRLVFGCYAPVANAIFEELAAVFPEKVVRRDRPKLVI